MWPNPQFPGDLVTFTEEILNGKLHFFVQCDTTLKYNIWKSLIEKNLQMKVLAYSLNFIAGFNWFWRDVKHNLYFLGGLTEVARDWVHPQCFIFDLKRLTLGNGFKSSGKWDHTWDHNWSKELFRDHIG